MNQDTIQNIADGMCKRLAENAVPDEEPCPNRIPWTMESIEPMGLPLSACIEQGGYTKAVAGPDFERVINACIAMIQGRIRGLVIWGPTGRGKTCAANAIAPGLLTREFKGLSEYSPPTLVPPVRVDCYAVASLTPDKIEEISNARGGNYWIEDAGVEPQVNNYGTRSDVIRNCIAAIAEKPSIKFIVTTNLDMAGLAKRYDERTVSRLCDSVGWLQLTGVDRRIENIVTF